MEKALAQEVRELVASARALVSELAEEGVDRFAQMPKSDRRPRRSWIEARFGGFWGPAP